MQGQKKPKKKQHQLKCVCTIATSSQWKNHFHLYETRGEQTRVSYLKRICYIKSTVLSLLSPGTCAVHSKLHELFRTWVILDRLTFRKNGFRIWFTQLKPCRNHSQLQIKLYMNLWAPRAFISCVLHDLIWVSSQITLVLCNFAFFCFPSQKTCTSKDHMKGFDAVCPFNTRLGGQGRLWGNRFLLPCRSRNLKHWFLMYVFFECI